MLCRNISSIPIDSHKFGVLPSYDEAREKALNFRIISLSLSFLSLSELSLPTTYSIDFGQSNTLRFELIQWTCPINVRSDKAKFDNIQENHHIL